MAALENAFGLLGFEAEPLQANLGLENNGIGWQIDV